MRHTSNPATARSTTEAPHWRDPQLPTDTRVTDLLERMTLDEKLAQLVGIWVNVSGSDERVVPHQDQLADDVPPWDELIEQGLGQLTRIFGTAPMRPSTGSAALARTQREVIRANRFGIPALAHEECLAGFTTWGATAYPVPLCWGASFDPDLVREMARSIGRDMRAVGVHQGLAPVLDVVRDPRWGRVEETAGEDPYLVGSVGSAYVAGLEASGIIATLKHFAGYSASRAGRNLAPVSMGRRELADFILPPFERALREGGARSVMHSYTDIDGVPSAADEELLTGLLREEWGFTGTVVADYFGISFLELLHGVAADPGAAGELALRAGVDIELPNARCYSTPLADRVRSGAVPEALVDRAVLRVLRQKCELGLLDPDWTPELKVAIEDLDPPENRALARKVAEESVVLLSNPAGLLPLAKPGRVAVAGPLADDPTALLGCYSFPMHVGVSYPDWPSGVELPTFLQEIRRGLGAEDVTYAPGDEAIGEAAEAASAADLCVAIVGDRAGLFGRGTSGEGCDAPDLSLPGRQTELVEALVDSGTPVVLVVCSGRPYALGAVADRLAACVQVFFPGEEGAGALVDVLTGLVNPSGRLPVSVPAHPGSGPATYLTAPLGTRSQVSSLDPTPLFAFGHGLSYSTFEYQGLRISEPETSTDGAVEVSCVVRNTGNRDGAEVVQLYLRDPVAQVTRPVRQLVGFARVPIPAAGARRVSFELHADRTCFSGRDGHLLVEPGEVELHLGPSSADTPLCGVVRLVGDTRVVGHDRVLDTPVRVDDVR